MKIRSGFVSNSSSSSFVCKGFLVDKADYPRERIMEAFEFDYKKVLAEWQANREWVSKYSDEELIQDIYYDEFRDFLEELRENNKIKGIYIGNDSEDGCPNEDTILIAEILFETKDGIDFNYMELDLEPTETLIKVKEKLNIEAPIKIICSSRCC